VLAKEGIVFRLSHLFVRPQQYLMNGVNNFDKTVGEYSLPSTDDQIRFWGSKVKVTAGLSVWHDVAC